jgi:UDP-GlcNAc:undecaprenyl-phosphate/decaprenyl-phosphate GlcNAc-1-phosphate transferase
LIALTLISAAFALLASLLFIRWAGEHAKQYDADKPQRFHVGAVPRLGGLAIMVGLFAGWLLAALSDMLGINLNVQSNWTKTWPWLVLTLPAVLGGAFEDVTQRLSVLYRLGLTAMSAALACYLLGISLSRLGIPVIDGMLLTLPWLGIALAVFAICGLPHAFNIIDGYNGLAGTVAAMVCLAIAHVSLQLGDRQLAAVVVCLAAATAGFLVWNYPRGLIFAGDGGAYLWGVVIAVASIMLVQRHDAVSPWFPMLLLIYPVWETLFSIYRKTARGVSPGVADALHFHQLIYRRLVRGVFHDDASRRMLMRNNRTSPWLWSFTLLTVAPAVLFWDSTLVLMAFCAVFVITYVVAYMMLVRFKVPKWLRGKTRK